MNKIEDGNPFKKISDMTLSWLKENNILILHHLLNRHKMLSELKKKQAPKKSAKSKGLGKVTDFTNDPFFLKKDEDARAFLKKHGFPKDLLPKK